jgi:hypothetical protein
MSRVAALSGNTRGHGLRHAYKTPTGPVLIALNQRGSLIVTQSLSSTRMTASGTTSAEAPTTDPRFVSKRGSGWLRQLRTQPLHAHNASGCGRLASVGLVSVVIVLATVSNALRVLGRGVRLAP